MPTTRANCPSGHAHHAPSVFPIPANGNKLNSDTAPALGTMYSSQYRKLKRNAMRNHRGQTALSCVAESAELLRDISADYTTPPHDPARSTINYAHPPPRHRR